MESSIFLEKPHIPLEQEVKTALGDNYSLWTQIDVLNQEKFSPIEKQWRFSGKKLGWTLKFSHKKKSINYVTPCQGFVRVSFALKDAEVALAHKSALPKAILDELINATKYPEGRPVRIVVKSMKDLEVFRILLEIKAAR